MRPTQLAKSGKEHGEQVALFAWAAMALQYGPKLAFEDSTYKPGVAKAYYVELPDYLKQDWQYTPMDYLQWMHAIHNQGHGDKIRGGIAKAEGVKAGVADLFLPVPSKILYTSGFPSVYPGVYHGLYIEMKRANAGKQSDVQGNFEKFVRLMGYQYKLCYGWVSAANAVIEYIHGVPNYWSKG